MPWTDVKAVRSLQAARMTRRLLTGTPVPAGFTESAVATQRRLAAGRVRNDGGLVHVRVGDFDVAGFSVSSLAYLHNEIFVKLAYYFRALRPAPLIVDGGSNIGMSVLFFKTLYSDARVLAFEPAEPSHRALVANVETNGLSGVEVHHAALGRENASVRFYEDPDDPATFRMSTRRERIRGRETTVPQRRLSEFLHEDVDLLKLDVEGAEGDVLDELIESGSITRIGQLVVEYHHQLDPERDFVDAFLERLRSNGFAYRISARERRRDRASAEPVFQDVLVYARRSG
jgi:FkbM family methyltransferase